MTGCTPTGQTGVAAPQPKQATAPAVPAAPAPQQAPPAPAPVTMEQQRTRQLIEQAETAYARGEADYRRGLLPEAKTEFDRAVDLLLASGYIKSSPQLQDELDKIVDQVNALEMEALKQGNGFVPKEEITPAEAASEVTFAVDPNIVAKATAELATTKSDLPLVVNDYVAVFINFFANTQKGHNTLLHSFQRSGHYRAMIQRVLAEEGVPQDLIYLAVAESGFNPRALNRSSHAGGMWQFMPYGTYGLTRNSYVDERFDPEKSTRAYGRYMKFIYDQLGDWYLAMAAYDHGTGNIQREVQRTGYADFWELYKRHVLPAETANYVPEILAAIIIANNPTQYGFDDITLDPPVLTDTVSIDYSINLRLVSDLVGAPLDEIEALNPSLLRHVTPPDTQFDLHLPAGTATLFEQRVALIPESQRNAWRYRKVAAGDTLQSVAQTFHVSASELASVNHLDDGASLASVEALAVPAAPSAESSSRSTSRTYTVRRGDTLVTIADRFGVSLSQLRSWNGISSGTKVAAGRRLRVAESQPTRSASTHSSRHHKASASSAESDSASSGKSEKTEKSEKAGKASSKKHSSSAKAKQDADKPESKGKPESKDKSESRKSSHKASGKSSSAAPAAKHRSSGSARHARHK